MKTLIKILITISFVFMLIAFAFAAWCAFNAFKIGDVSSVVMFAMCASVDLLCFIGSILLFTKL